ncbi:MAG: hypothetical protein IJU52_07955 [Clostridia bacterium]|nr:hypothetical protein [Clostridia bacterium]
MERRKDDLSREACLALLREKYAYIKESGEERYPKRSDFSPREVEAIKAFFGPWPRALERAGVKPERNDDRPERNREKRRRAKRARNAARKAQKQLKAQNAEIELPPEGSKK